MPTSRPIVSKTFPQYYPNLSLWAVFSWAIWKVQNPLPNCNPKTSMLCSQWPVSQGSNIHKKRDSIIMNISFMILLCFRFCRILNRLSNLYINIECRSMGEVIRKKGIILFIFWDFIVEFDGICLLFDESNKDINHK